MAVSWSARVTTTTQDHFMPMAVQTVLNGNVAATRFLNGAKSFRGETMKRPVIVDATNRGGSFSGYDTLNTNAIDTRVNLSFTPSFVYEPASVALTELAGNKASKEEQILDLMAITVEESAQRMADEVGDQMWSDGTGNSSKDILGLEAAVDDGGSVATYGGQSRSTYTSLASTETASGGSLTLAKVDTLYTGVTSGNQKPTVGYVTETVWNLYGQLLRPMERINKTASDTKGLRGGTGFTALAYNGVDIIADEKAVAGHFEFLNEDHIDFYAIDPSKYMLEPVRYKKQTEGMPYTPDGLGFGFTGWVRPANQLALVGQIVLGGQLISWHSKRHGKLTGITGI